MSSVAAQQVQTGGVSSLVERCRAVARRVARVEADRLELVAEVLAGCEAEVPVAGLRVAERRMFVRDVAAAEVAATFAVSEHIAARWVALAERLTMVLPVALRALRSGGLDLARVQVLAEATEVLDDDLAAQVAARLLAGAGSSVFDGPSPRVWKGRVERAVVRADADAAAARYRRERAARAVRAWAAPDGAGVFRLHADAADIAMVDRVVDDLAQAWPTHDPDGARLTLDQRRADAVIDLFRRVRDTGADQEPVLPVVPVRRVTHLGLVLHADTLFDDGPRRRATAEQRGLGRPTVLDPSTARQRATRQLQAGTGVQVLVVDDQGGVQHVMRVPAAACADRETLIAAVRAAPRHAMTTDRYAPTAAITRHVHAAAPTCSAYDCPRSAAGCDLDHSEPWPRGPTSITNLDPKCRRHHQAKTHAVVRSRLHADGGLGTAGRRVTWTYRSGLTVTTHPEPLPGCR